MKFYLYKYLSRCFKLLFLFISIINIKVIELNADETYKNNLESEGLTKPEDSRLGLQSNPFQIVEMLRRANSMNDATKPSDAIDDALNSFTMIEDK